MALRLRKDVQKASYYVWFLGAEEARGLRGPRVLLPAIPHLIERSREHEPLKVTLQVSHKGMKIVQGSSKHFITHSAITCSVQAEDIVACVLLLYNPSTKCPLHVHAYRCDSETTAQALHQFLQVLINRPENQKRFAELEARLGIQPVTNAVSSSRNPQPKQAVKRTKETSPRRFESSLGSDTGTSTRESECSEELSPTSPTAPVSPNKASLYDSLAAELRAKLNGNGPPLLLPPRDYDTVHRSKGNLAATELRRCRNSLIVGGPGTKNIKGVASRSRGSSGIGSDLAPSPEQNDGHTSSDDDWVHNTPEKVITPIQKVIRRPVVQRTFSPEKIFEPYDDEPPSYLYPQTDAKISNGRSAVIEQSSKPKNVITPTRSDHGKRIDRSSSREEERKLHNSREEEIKPIIIRPRNFDSRFKDIIDERKYIDDTANEDDRHIVKELPTRDEIKYRYPSNDYVPEKHHQRTNAANISAAVQQPPVERKYRTAAEIREKRFGEDEPDKSHRYHEQNINDKRRSYDRDGISTKKYIDNDTDYKLKMEKENYRENLTDRQKYRESLLEKQKLSQGRIMEKSFDRNEYYEQQPQHHHEPVTRPPPHESFERNKVVSKSKMKYEMTTGEKKPTTYPIGETTIDRTNYRHRNAEKQQTQQRNTGYNDRPFYDYDKSVDRNPYKEPDSLPYHESIERMIKSPVMRYKSFGGESSERDLIMDDEQNSHDKSFNSHKAREKSRNRSHEYEKSNVEFNGKYEHDPPLMSRRRIMERQRSLSRSPETIMKVSPKDRFQDAKEKFQAMERERVAALEASKSRRAVERRGSFEHREHSTHDRQIDWSSEDEQPPRMPTRPTSSGYRDLPAQRYAGGENGSRVISPAKSLGNLVKGYRHSYAEPRNQMPRNSGRVGLAAVNPF